MKLKSILSAGVFMALIVVAQQFYSKTPSERKMAELDRVLLQESEAE